MKNSVKLLAIIAIIAVIGFSMAGCDKDPDPPQPHQSTITAFGRTITVTGDASISTADFNTVKGKLEQTMVHLSNGTIPPKFEVMLDRPGFQIIIKTGNAGPNADANKSMTIGVDYLLNNDVESKIGLDIATKVLIDDAFTD